MTEANKNQQDSVSQEEKVEAESPDENISKKEGENNLEDKVRELNEKYLRLLAENENLRKNHQQENLFALFSPG